MVMSMPENDVSLLEQEIAEEPAREVALLYHAGGYGVISVEVKDGTRLRGRPASKQEATQEEQLGWVTNITAQDCSRTIRIT